MKVLITGGSGFVGRHVSRHYCAKGDYVIAVGRSARHSLEGENNFEYISADTTRDGTWQDRVDEADAVINLTGKNIFKYWTEAYKKEIYDSRILTTRRLVAALEGKGSAVLFNTSAIGYYGDRGETLLTEEVSPGNDFLAGVCVDWEKEALKAAAKGTRVVIMRFGIVLGEGGGALAKMIPAFRFFVGGPMASGEQWFPWQHIEDLTAAIDFIYADGGLEGPFNFCSPGTVRNKAFAATLGRVLGRPAYMRVPGFVIKLLMGEMGRALLSSQRGVPERLEKAGFRYRFADLEKALTDVV